MDNFPFPGSIKCKKIARKIFKKGDIINILDANESKTGFISKGIAHISLFDDIGRESIIDKLTPGDCFNESFAPPIPNRDSYIIADSDCTVLYINLKDVLYNCRSACKWHIDLIRSLVLILSFHSLDQSIHISILSQRTIRDKILAYLSHYKQLVNSDGEFTIRISFSELANYLAVDRSAMMREIKNMNEEGIIRSSGRTFALSE